MTCPTSRFWPPVLAAFSPPPVPDTNEGRERIKNKNGTHVWTWAQTITVSRRIENIKHTPAKQGQGEVLMPQHASRFCTLVKTTISTALWHAPEHRSKTASNLSPHPRPWAHCRLAAHAQTLKSVSHLVACPSAHRGPDARTGQRSAPALQRVNPWRQTVSCDAYIGHSPWCAPFHRGGRFRCRAQ